MSFITIKAHFLRVIAFRSTSKNAVKHALIS